MVKFLTLSEMFNRLRHKKKFNTIVDKLTFFDIFIIWASLVTLFGFVYFVFSNNSSFLTYSATQQQVKALFDNIYFSFITATSLGFGDILPSGIFKILVIVEVVLGSVLLAFVISKLISIKQNIILNEIYEISFNERINRIRSSLLIFRQNLGRLIDKVEDNVIRKREINDIYIYLTSLEDILNDILAIIEKRGNHYSYFTKDIDPLNTQLLYNSILQSFEKLDELIRILKGKQKEWKRDITLTLISNCINTNELLFNKLNTTRNIGEKTIIDLNVRKKITTDSIMSGLKQQEAQPQQKTLLVVEPVIENV